jgi:hypothetical protein
MSENEDEKTTPIAITMDRILEVLKRGKIDHEYGILRWSSNYTFLVSVSYEDTELTAVYKPQSGERPLWDFPDGTLCQREVAAFLTSHELGWDIVPPTVLREGSRGLGSVQFYIEHDPQVNYFGFDESAAPQLMRISAFDCIVNNADRKGGHCLVDSQEHIWGIDHGIAFHTSHKLRTVIWDFAGQAIPAPLLLDLERLCVTLDNAGSAYRQALCKLLTGGEINAFHARLRHLLKTRRYPFPGPGPNYPWPPV